MATQVSLNDGAVASAGALAIQTNGTTQAVSISTGQVATLAQNPILTSGTTNGVAYLNGSKVLTTGSALTFDGTNLGLSNSAAAAVVKIDGSGRYKQFETYSSGTRQFYIGWDNTSQVANITNDNNYPILFSITGTEQMRLTSTGLKTKTTISVGDATPSTSGAGITFPATQSASSDANTLDDYEEGTWTPSLGGTATYTTQSGFYTKIGRQVTIWGNVTVNAIGTGSTSQISGNPFVPASGIIYMPGSVYWESLAISETNLIAITQGSSGNIWFAGRATASTSIDNVVAIFGNSTLVRFCITYNV